MSTGVPACAGPPGVSTLRTSTTSRCRDRKRASTPSSAAWSTTSLDRIVLTAVVVTRMSPSSLTTASGSVPATRIS